MRTIWTHHHDLNRPCSRSLRVNRLSRPPHPRPSRRLPGIRSKILQDWQHQTCERPCLLACNIKLRRLMMPPGRLPFRHLGLYRQRRHPIQINCPCQRLKRKRNIPPQTRTQSAHQPNCLPQGSPQRSLLSRRHQNPSPKSLQGNLQREQL